MNEFDTKIQALEILNKEYLEATESRKIELSEQLIPQAERELLVALFTGYPEIKSFTLYCNFNSFGQISLLTEINDLASFRSDYRNGDNFKSWLVEVNINEDDYDRILEVSKRLSKSHFLLFFNATPQSKKYSLEQFLP